MGKSTQTKKLPNETNNKTHFAKYSKPERKEIAERRNIWCNKEWFINICLSWRRRKKSLLFEKMWAHKSWSAHTDGEVSFYTKNNELWHANIMLPNFFFIFIFLYALFCSFPSADFSSSRISPAYTFPGIVILI